MPERIQLKRTRGWRMPPNTTKCARPGKWGNPFRVERDGERWRVATEDERDAWGDQRFDTKDEATREAVAAFRANLLRGTLGYTLEDVQRELRGKNLACFCPLPKSGERDFCHAAELLYYANEEP